MSDNKKVYSKFLSSDMTTDIELSQALQAESALRTQETSNLQAQLDARAAEYVATANTNTVTTSTLPVLLAGTRITPLAGKYLAVGGSSFQSSTNNAEIDLTLYVDSTPVTGSTRTVTPKSSNQDSTEAPRPVTVNGVITVNGSQAIELRWSTSAGTATARERSLTLIRIG